MTRKITIYKASLSDCEWTASDKYIPGFYNPGGFQGKIGGKGDFSGTSFITCAREVPGGRAELTG
jgi:hypothetical protein